MSCKPRGLALLLPLALLLVAPCAFAQSPSPSLDDALFATDCDETSGVGSEAVDQAVVGFDLDPGTNSLSCHGWTSCPDPKSCSNWSGFFDCGSVMCGYDSYCETKTGGDARVQPRERFRDCTLLDGSSCREYQLYTFRIICGCGGL